MLATSFALAALLVIVALLVGLVSKSKSRKHALRYSTVRPLTEPEQTLYWRLVEALPECVILAQVTFSRFMRPNVPSGSAAYTKLQNRISQKSADFVVCLKDFTVVAIVEVDDSTHSVINDEVRDQLVESAGLTVLRVTTRNLPSSSALRTMFAK